MRAPTRMWMRIAYVAINKIITIHWFNSLPLLFFLLFFCLLMEFLKRNEKLWIRYEMGFRNNIFFPRIHLYPYAIKTITDMLSHFWHFHCGLQRVNAHSLIFFSICHLSVRYFGTIYELIFSHFSIEWTFSVYVLEYHVFSYLENKLHSIDGRQFVFFFHFHLWNDSFQLFYPLITLHLFTLTLEVFLRIVHDAASLPIYRNTTTTTEKKRIHLKKKKTTIIRWLKK